jgi:methylated-DNA-protein-cysteine methyltransferase-like protein
VTSRRDQRAGAAERDRRILDVVRALGPGEVVSYGDVADDAGHPGRSRLVGTLLATTEDTVPWWRVVTSTGRLVPGAERDHAARLRAEGVVVRGSRVVSAPSGRFSRSPRP